MRGFHFLFLLFILALGCQKRHVNPCCQESKIPDKVEIESVQVIGGSEYFTHKGVKFWVTWSLWRDKDQVQIEFADERVADDKLATVEKREAIRQKVSKVETVKNVRVIHRSEYVLTIANEDWGKNKEKVFDAMLEE